MNKNLYYIIFFDKMTKIIEFLNTSDQIKYEIRTGKYFLTNEKINTKSNNFFY